MRSVACRFFPRILLLLLAPGAAFADDVPDLRTRKSGVDWPQFLGPTQDSKSPEQGIRTDWTEGKLPIVWQRHLGTSYGICSISRGRLFQFDRYGDAARLTCLHSETGKELWQFEYPTDYEDMYGYNKGPRCCPVVDDDRVYIYGAEGMLHCLRVVDGSLVWKVDTMAEYDVEQNFFGVGSTPVVEGDLLLVQVGGSLPGGSIGAGTLEGNGTGLVALNKLTGAEVYRCSDELASYATPVTASIGDRRWCFLFARGGLLGLEPASGQIDFHYPWRARIVESVNASNPVVVGDLVFISESYGPGSSLLRVRPGGYEVVWSDDPRSRDKSLQTHWNTAIHHEGYLYGSSGRHTGDAELRCIDLQTGEVQWSQPELTRSSLLYVDGHFVCLTEYGHLLLIEATPERFRPVTAVLLESPEADPRFVRPPPLLRYPAWAAPILSHGLLYVRGADRLVCLELIPAESDETAN